MLNAQPAVVQGLVGQRLLHRQLLTAGFLRRHEDIHVGERKRQKAEILQEAAPGGQGIRRGLGNALVMDMAAVGLAQKEEWGGH